jgi:GT2 family glycosyltransferase
VPWETDLIVGNCVLYPALAIRSVGLMDERTFPHAYSDVVYSAKMRARGWHLVIEPRAIAYCESSTEPPLRTRKLSVLLQALLTDRRRHTNLVQILRLLWRTAPNRALGVLAFGVHTTRCLLRFAGILRYWPQWE